MTIITKFDIPKFNDKMSFNVWKVQMMVVLTQIWLKKAIGGKKKKPEATTDDQWDERDEKVPSTIQLCLATHVLREVRDMTAGADLFLRLESLYMTKSLGKEIRIKDSM